MRVPCPATQVLVLTSYAEERQVEETLKAGALGYALKSIVAADLVCAILTVARGQTWLHDRTQAALLSARLGLGEPPTE